MLPRIAAAMAAVATFMLLRRVASGTFGDRKGSDLFAAAVAGTFFVTFLGCALAWQPSSQSVAPASAVSFFEVGPFCRIARPLVIDKGVGAIDFVRSGGVGVTNDGEISSAKRFVVAGWASDSGGAASAIAVCPIIDGKVSAAGHALYGMSRPDLPAGARLSGFALEFLKGELPRGKHAIGASVLSRNGLWQRVGSPVTLTIT